MFSVAMLILAFLNSVSAVAKTNLTCKIKSGVMSEIQLDQKSIQKSEMTLKINEPTISRCSRESSGKFTCDDYKIDKTVETKVGDDMVIRKFYHFTSQFNAQIFIVRGKTEVIEDNGRGMIYFGDCL